MAKYIPVNAMTPPGFPRWAMARLSLPAALFALLTSVRAQNPAEEGEHEALRSLRTLYEEAVNQDKLDLLAPHLHESFSGVMLTNEVIGSLDEMKAYWGKMKAMMGKEGRYTVKVIPDRSLILGNIAVAKGKTEDIVVTTVGEYRFGSNWTAVLEKTGGLWKLLRVQGSMDPIGNPFIQSMVKAAATFASTVSGLIAVVVGCLIGFLIGRKRKRG